MSLFYSRLSYSFGNEDPKTEQKALQIQPGNRVLCITASGDRPLHLLLDDAKEVVCIDANPVQNHLLKLKIEALRTLDDDHYLSFLGVQPCIQRKQTLRELSLKMDKDTARFWLDNERLVSQGIIYQGATEKWTRKSSWFLRMLRKREIKHLFEMETLEEQRAFLQNHWNHKFWKNAFRFGINRWFSKLIIKDPGLYANVDPHFKPGVYLYERMMRCLDRSLAKENALISLILRGSVGSDALPPYLTTPTLDVIRKRVDRITTHTTNAISYLENLPENSFDRFSLSDIASYMDQASFLRLLKAMYRAAKPEARFCMRQFMSRYKVPEGLKPWFQTEPELETSLEKEDQAFVYHFTVGKVLKP